MTLFLQYIQSQDKLMIGGYHPQLAFALITDHAKTGVAGNSTAEMFLNCVEGNNLDVAQATEYVNVVMDEILDYVESTRIDSPDITAFEIAGSKARIDTQTHTIRLRKPAGQSWTSETPVIETNGDTYVELKSGSLSSGSDRLVYRVTPYCPVTGILYNGQKDAKGGVYTGSGARLDSYHRNGQSVQRYYLLRCLRCQCRQIPLRHDHQRCRRDGENTITLNLPVKTDLTKLKPVITHMGKTVSILNGSTWEVISPDKTYDFSQPRQLRVTNEQYQLETDYTVTVTANPSSECDILSYSIGHATGVIDQENRTITIEVPYGTALNAQTPVVEVSEFAKVTGPSTLTFGQPLTYRVTAEDDNTTKDYRVTITETPAATGKSILSFSYGSISATISGTNITPERAVWYGCDGAEAQHRGFSVCDGLAAVGYRAEFYKSVQYTVTAQNKSQQVYTVTVKVADKPTDPPEKDKLYRIRNNILCVL